MLRLALLLLSVIALVGISHNSLAHDARPVVISITAQLPGAYQFAVSVPETVESGNQPSVVWPEACVVQNIATANNSSSGLVVCEDGLNGKSLTLDYPYFNPSLASFYRLTTHQGETMTAMLTPMRAQWDVPLEPSPGNVALEYLALGLEHILSGVDHLLFVLGLLLIARTMKRILWTVTGFTLAHSITLSLSSLGFVAIPIVPVEAAIALSIVFLAFEISGEDKTTLTYQYPLLVSFGFGLLHGLGFASALGEIGLVESEVLFSLLFFNLGVEVGQVAFILFVSAVFWCLNKYRVQFVKTSAVVTAVTSPRHLDLLAGYVIGIPASYWLIDRLAQFLF